MIDLNVGGIAQDNNINDFMVSGESLKIPKNTNTVVHEYNQYTTENSELKNTRWSCGIFSAMGTVSDLTGYKFTETDRLEIQRLAIDIYGLKVPGGMLMSKAIDCVRNWWNTKYPDNKIVSYRLTIGDSDYTKALIQGHSLTVGYKTSREYSLEQNTGVISSEDFPKGGGHLVRNTSIKEFSHIRDNYIGIKKYNTYQNEKIIPLMKNWVYFPSAYLFLYDENNRYLIEREKKLAEITELIEYYKEKGIKRIRIYDDLRAYGYNARYIDYCLRKVYGLNITSDMQI